MTDTAQQAWRRWWDEEGSEMHPLPNEDAEQFARRMTEIAWSNGAFKRLADVEYLCLNRVGLERELAAAKAELSKKIEELAAMKKERDEARRELCDLKSTPRLCAYIFVTARRYADERGWDCFAQQEGGGA